MAIMPWQACQGAQRSVCGSTRSNHSTSQWWVLSISVKSEQNNLLFVYSVQGWTNPLFGSIKAGVVESANPEAGYEAAHREGGHIRSKNFYIGKDEKGNTTKFYIQVSASPGNDPMSFVVQQVAAED